MPLAPFAKLRASINGGGIVTGGNIVPASATVQLSADPTASVGAIQYKYEIYGFPIGFTQPASWSTDSNGVYFYNSSSSTPPIFTLPTIANWGKFMLRLTLNNGISTNTKVIPVSQLIDESTALSILSPTGLSDVGAFESNQFNQTWLVPVQASLRAVDNASTAVSGATAKPAAKLLGASNVTLSNEQTIDGVLTTASRVLLIAQSISSQNGLWVTAAGSWTRPTDFSADAQVIVGQTIFVTSGSLNSGTNWQLTSGSTIAGAKTFAQLVGGSSSSILQPVDAVTTTNNGLSGTTSIDGVTLTANSSRVLTTAQSTASQNGPWLVQSGSWTRPTDFAVDAQVVSGQSVYVKSGTLGSGTSWQLTTGNTISGSKTYSKVTTVRHESVRAVQTATLPPNTYSVGIITGTSALTDLIFDGIGPTSASPLLVGDRVLVNSLGIANTKNGIYVVTSFGGSAYVLTRASDLDSSSEFVGGVQFDVVDGATVGGNFKGTRWYLTNSGTIILDTTATIWMQMRPKGSRIDLSLPPYNVVDAKNFSQATDCGPALKKFLYDYSGQLVTGYLPNSNGGWIIANNQLPHYGGVTIQGGGRGKSTLAAGLSLRGGPLVIAQFLTNPSGGNGFPGIGGTLVDSAGDSPLSFWRDTSGATNKQYFYNLGDAGLLIDDWTNFEMRMLVRFETLTDPGGSGSLHMVSCRGQDIDNTVSELFRVRFNKTTHQLTGTLRLTDTTKGTYGATVGVNVGGGTSAVAGDTIMKPTEDAPNFAIRVKVGGTIGTPGIVVDYAVDGFRFGPEIALGTNSNLVTIPRLAYVFGTPTAGSGAASLVATSNVTLSAEQTIDGAMTAASRVLLTNQTAPAENGLWITSSGAWARATDLDSDAEVAAFFAAHKAINVIGGSANAGTDWQITSGTTLAASKTFQKVLIATFSDVNEHAQPFAAKVTFAAGTLIAGATYTIPCSGVNTTITSTSATSILINTNYEVLLQYDGSNVLFQVSVADGTTARDAGITTSATGIVRQRWWEQTHLGCGYNIGVGDSKFEQNGITAWLGSIRFMSSSVVAPSGAAATTINKNTAGVTYGTPTAVPGQAFRWQPKSSQLVLDAGGVFPISYGAEITPTGYSVQINPRTPNTGPQLSGGGFEDLSFSLANSFGLAIVSQAWLDRKFKDLQFNGGSGGWSNAGPDFGSTDESLVFNTGVTNNSATGLGVALRWFQGSINALGTWQFQNGTNACWMMTSVAALSAPGTIFMNGEQLTTKCGMVHDRMLTSFINNWSYDNENQQNHQGGREFARVDVSSGSSFKIGGNITGGTTQNSIITNTSSAGRGYIEFDNFTVAGGIVMPPLSAYRSDCQPFLATRTAMFNGITVPICDRANKVLRVGGTLGPVAIPDAGPVPSWFRGMTAKLSKDTITADRTYALDITGMQVGDQYRILVESQTGHTVQFTNTGRAGGNLLSVVLPAATEGSYKFRLNESFNLERT